MLQTIRDRITSWIAYVIIGLIIITFALWGIGSYFADPTTPDVAEVNDTPITLQEFQYAFQQQRQQIPQIDAGFLKQLVLQQLINERLLLQTAREQGIRISDQLLQQAIVSQQVFHEDGVFNPNRYRQILSAQNLTEVAFEQSLRTSLMIEQLREGVAGSAFVTPAAVDDYIRLLKQQRAVQYIALPFDDYIEKTTVDDAAIADYFQENKDRFLHPEQVKIQYLELDLEKMAESIPVSQEELQTAYEENLAQYTQPEERSASHILVTIPPEATAADIEEARSRAQAIYTDITSGVKTYDHAAAELKGDETVETGELGVVSKGLYEDSAFETALYDLATKGDVSPPVQTEFGFHIIRLDEIRSETVKPLAAVEDELREELSLRQAENRFYDLSENLFNLIYEHPESLDPAAQALDLEIQESSWFSRQGGEGVAAYPEIVTAAYSEDVLKQGLNSDPIELDEDKVLVLRMQDHRQAKPKTLQEAREEIVTELKQRQAREAIAKDAKTLQDRAAQGESLTQLAKEFNGELKTLGLVERDDTKADAALLDIAFDLPKPKADTPSFGVATLGNGDQVVVAVNRIIPGKSDALPEEERNRLRQQLAGRIGATLFDGFLASLRDDAEIVTYNDRL